jgi:uncharacterized protein with FMN-binding domain
LHGNAEILSELADGVFTASCQAATTTADIKIQEKQQMMLKY